MSVSFVRSSGRRTRPTPHRWPIIEVLENRCVLASGTFPSVPDVEGQFVALKHHAEGLGYFLPDEEQGAPDPTNNDHHQGVVRYPGTGTPVLYVTQKNDDDTDNQGGTTGGYLEVIRLGSRGTDGERLRSNLQIDGAETENTLPPASDTWLQSYRFNGIGISLPGGETLPAYIHLGGLAIIDNILFVAMDQPADAEAAEGMIVLFNLGADGALRETPIPIKAFPLDHGIDNLAVTRMSDEHYLIWTNGDSGNEIHVYHLSDPALQLEHVQDWTDSAANFESNGIDWPTGLGAHQGSTFIRQSDGALYLIGMRRDGLSPLPTHGEDHADLYRVTDNGSGGLKLTLVRDLHMFNEFEGVGTLGNFKAANNAYVSPTGELILYSVQHDDVGVDGPDYVKFAEFRHRDVNRPGSPLRVPGADAGGPYTVAEGGSVVLSGSATPVADRPWVELFDDTFGWLHKFEHPDDHEGDRSIVVDYDDRFLYELANFGNLDGPDDVIEGHGFNDKPTSIRWRAPVGLDIELFDDDHFEDRKIILKGTGQTEEIGELNSQVVVPDVVEHPGRDAGEELEFSDKASSMRFIGSPPDPGALTFEWDLDGDGFFGETGAAAGRGDETTANPTFSAAGLDGPGAFTVSLRVSDDAGVSSISTVAIAITNAAPTLATLTSSNPDLAHASPDGAVTIGGSFTDPAGPLDTHSVNVNWGDGTPLETLPPEAVDQAGDTFTHAHTYADGGIFTVTVTVADEDGGVSDERTTTAVATGVGLVEGVLYAIGTDGRDQVLVKGKDQGAQLVLEVKLSDGRMINKSFDTAAVDHLVIYLGAGDDLAQIQDNVTTDALVLGADGEDVLFGGGGYNVLVGGSGNDELFGGELGDILIGGDGEDHLHGKKGNDILIAGLTDKDDDLAALDAALAAWKAADLSGVLAALLTLHDDEDEDDLAGDLGDDELFGGIGDILK